MPRPSPIGSGNVRLRVSQCIANGITGTWWRPGAANSANSARGSHHAHHSEDTFLGLWEVEVYPPPRRIDLWWSPSLLESPNIYKNGLEKSLRHCFFVVLVSFFVVWWKFIHKSGADLESRILARIAEVDCNDAHLHESINLVFHLLPLDFGEPGDTDDTALKFRLDCFCWNFPCIAIPIFFRFHGTVVKRVSTTKKYFTSSNPHHDMLKQPRWHHAQCICQVRVVVRFCVSHANSNCAEAGYKHAKNMSVRLLAAPVIPLFLRYLFLQLEYFQAFPQSRYFHPCVKFLLSSRSFGQNRLLPVVVPCPWEGFLVLLASSFYFTSLHLEIWTCKDQRIAFCIHVIGLSQRLEEKQLDQTHFMWAHVWRGNMHTAAVESL